MLGKTAPSRARKRLTRVQQFLLRCTLLRTALRLPARIYFPDLTPLQDGGIDDDGEGSTAPRRFEAEKCARSEKPQIFSSIFQATYVL